MKLIHREKVTTTKIRTSKTKKNIEKNSKYQNIESVFLVHHYYKNQNVEKNEKNIESLSFVRFLNFDKVILPMA